MHAAANTPCSELQGRLPGWLCPAACITGRSMSQFARVPLRGLRATPAPHSWPGKLRYQSLKFVFGPSVDWWMYVAVHRIDMHLKLSGYQSVLRTDQLNVKCHTLKSAINASQSYSIIRNARQYDTAAMPRGDRC